MTTRTKAKDKEDSEILARQLAALELRKSGWSYRKIGEKLKVSHVQIQTDIKSELKRLADINLESADELRQLEIERLDKITERLDHWLEAGNVPAVLACIKAGQERSKLLGLYAAEKKEISGENGKPIPVLVTGMDMKEL